jgi:hypothetical protein
MCNILIYKYDYPHHAHLCSFPWFGTADALESTSCAQGAEAARLWLWAWPFADGLLAFANSGHQMGSQLQLRH